MTVKEYLGQLGGLNKKIKHKKQELIDAKSSRGITMPSSDGEKVCIQTSFSGGGGNQTASQAIRIVALQEDIESRIIEYMELRNLIIDQIHALNDSMSIDILYKRYVQEQRHFEKIAFDMGYAYQYIINKHGEALKKFEERFPELFVEDVIKCEDILKKA